MAITKEGGRTHHSNTVVVSCFRSLHYQRIVFGKNYNLSAIDGINSCDVQFLLCMAKRMK